MADVIDYLRSLGIEVVEDPTLPPDALCLVSAAPVTYENLLAAMVRVRNDRYERLPRYVLPPGAFDASP